jgi:hypothetical protein
MTQIPEALTWCLAAGTTAGAVMAPILVRSRRQVSALRQDA